MLFELRQQTDIELFLRPRFGNNALKKNVDKDDSAILKAENNVDHLFKAAHLKEKTKGIENFVQLRYAQVINRLLKLSLCRSGLICDANIVNYYLTLLSSPFSKTTTSTIIVITDSM